MGSGGGRKGYESLSEGHELRTLCTYCTYTKHTILESVLQHDGGAVASREEGARLVVSYRASRLSRQHEQARAATNYMFISMNNSCTEHAWPSRFLTPDGMIVAALEANEPGVMVNEVDTTRKYYDASRSYRLDAISGKLNSGQVVDDPRSKDRACY